MKRIINIYAVVLIALLLSSCTLSICFPAPIVLASGGPLPSIRLRKLERSHTHA